MTFRPLLVLLVSLALSTLAYGQCAHVWLPDTTLRISGPLPFDHVTIEDIRADKSSIGYIKTGAFNRYADLVMEDSVKSSLAAYATHLLRGVTTVPGHLLVVLRDFRIEDMKGTEEIGTVHLRADLFLSGTGEDAFFHLRSHDTLYEVKRLDVTKAVQERASHAVFNMLTLARDAAASPAPTIYSRTEALTHEDDLKAAWPLYTSAAPPRGIYYNLDDVLHLRTADTSFTDLKVLSSEGPATWYFYRKNSRGKKGRAIRPKECLAIYDGERWHISNGFRFGSLKKDVGDFYTTVFLDGMVDNSATWGLFFGMVGSLIALSDRSPHPAPYHVRLVPEAGRFVPVRRVR